MPDPIPFVVFLLHLLLVIAFLLSEVFLQTNFLALPYQFVLWHFVGWDQPALKVHPYIPSGLLLVSVTTLVLFFASGMYSEKIGYANQ